MSPPSTYPDSDSESNDESSSQSLFSNIKNLNITGGTFVAKTTIHNHNEKQGLQRLADAIKDGEDALRDAHQPEKRKCFPKTRQSTLNLVTSWIVDSHPSILWLSGPAGVGKTAIAHTLCRRIQRKGILVGGFFFSRNRPHKAKLLFPTLAYELAIRFPRTADMIADKVATDPLITSREMGIQLSELILSPLRRFLDPNDPPVVFVIDGLDECESDEVQCDIIDLIQNAIRRNHHLPLRFVITSRPEKWIKDKFSNILHVGVSLEETDETREDIRKYLAHGFMDIYEKRDDVMREVPLPWPSVEDMWCLVDKASGQFIYASTVLKYMDDNESSPVKRLQNILSINQDSVFGAELDELYTQILNRVTNFDRTRDVLAGLLLVSSDAYRNEILSILEVLLGFQSGDGYAALTHLHSVLDIRKHREGPGINTQYAVHIHHKSFTEFLTCNTRSSGFFIDTAAYHARLAIGCARVLMHLKVPARRPSYIAWDYATMRLGYHCKQSGGKPSSGLIVALQELDVSACLLPILLKTERKTLQDAEPKIRKKLPGRRRSSASNRNLDFVTTDEAITMAMGYLSSKNLTCSFSIVHDGLLDLRDWLEEHANCKPLSRLLQDIKIIVKEIREAQIYKPRRRH